MALAGSGDAWGSSIVSAILALNPDSGSMTSEELETITEAWQTLAGVHASHITGNSVINPGSFITTDVTTGVETVTGATEIS